MKNKTFFKLFIILLIAFLFRFWFIDKPEGLWNDEYVSWFIASKESFSEFIKYVSKNCHTPLYYIFLKFWLALFPDTDISLRVSSVIMSLFTVVTMFFAGKEFKDNKTGLLCSFFTAVSSFYIYFAQEVRLYSLLSFISSLIVLTGIKLLREGKKRLFALFVILNALLCAVHTLGLVFSFFIILFSTIYLYKNFDEWKLMIKNSNETLKYAFPFLCILLLISPFIFSILFSKTLSQFWSEFSFFKPVYVFMDYFSPIQCNITNSPVSIISYLSDNQKLNINFIFFAIIPSIIAIIGIIKGIIIRNKILNILLLACLCFLGVAFVLSAAGKMILLSKYISEIYPVLILAFSAGILSFKSNTIKNIILITYFLLSISYLYYSPNSAPKIMRREGNNLPVVLIEKSRLKPNDFIIFTYYDKDKFERYFKNANNYKIYSISKFNFNVHIFNNSSYLQTVNEGKSLYREQFKEFPNKNIINWTQSLIINMMKKGDKVGIICLDGVSFFSNETIQDIISDTTEHLLCF